MGSAATPVYLFDTFAGPDPAVVRRAARQPMTTAATAPRTTTRELTDADAIHDHLAATYGTAMRMTCTDDRYLFRHRRVDAGSFAMESAEQFNWLHFAADPVRLIVVTQVSTARMERCCGRIEGRYAADDLFMVADPDLPYILRWAPGAITNCVIDPTLLARVAAPAPGRRPERIRFTGLDPGSPAAATCWWATRRYVSGLLDNPAAAAIPLLVSSAADLLAAATLATFPNTALTDPTIEDSHDASGTTLRHAVAYIDDHAAGDVSLAGIAEAAHVSVRAAQLAFRRHLDTTPMAYLRRVRLDHAHHALIAADPEKTTVAGIAARWGFANHSRFTALYRTTYGMLPSATLRRSS